MSDPIDRRHTLIELAHTLGVGERKLAILGEGNVSAKLDGERFLVKASGSNLATLDEGGVVECYLAPILELLKSAEAADEKIDETLFNSRVDAAAKKPSVETIFHADLLSLEGSEYVCHVHPVAVNSILCSPRAEEFALHRLFPDEVVCCGPASVYVPYADPGLKLAQAIRSRLDPFIERHAVLPRVILLQSHGIITLGASAAAATAALFMAVKAAEIFLGAALHGGPVFLSEAEINRIAGRADEHHRQRALGL